MIIVFIMFFIFKCYRLKTRKDAKNHVKQKKKTGQNKRVNQPMVYVKKNL